MSNVVIIEYINPFHKGPTGTPFLNITSLPFKFEYSGKTEPEILISNLKEDIQLQIETEFDKPSSFIPGSFQGILDLISLSKTASGKASRGANILDVMDVPVWKSTQPIRFELKLQFFTEDNPINDVYRPIVGLISLCMLTPDENKKDAKSFRLPGINFANIEAIKADKTTTTVTLGEKALGTAFSKLIALEIPNIIYLPKAIVEKATPTFSKELTKSGYPLWGEVQLTILGLRSANTDMFVKVDSGFSDTLNAAANSISPGGINPFG